MKPSIPTLVSLLAAAAVALPARADSGSPPPPGFSMVSVGRLLDGTDQPVEATQLQMTFRIFRASAPIDGEQPLWTGNYSVDVHQGLYSVVLGGASDADKIPASIFDGGLVYLEASIGSVTLLPRERIGMTPMAAGTLTLGGHPASDFALKSDVDAAVAGMQTSLDLKANASDLSALQAATYSKTDVDGKLSALTTSEASDVATLRSDLDGVKTNLTADEAKIATNAGAIATLQAGLSNANSSISSLQGSVSTANTGISSLQSGLATADTNITTLQSGLASANTSIATVQSSLAKYLPLAGGDVTGKLGIGVANPLGPLSVNGSIQLGMDNSTCDASHAGMIRWNPTSKAFEGCTGPIGGWQLLAAEPDTSWMLTTDSCGGFRQSSWNSTVRFAVSSSTTWDTTKKYACPAGYHWASTAEGTSIFNGPNSGNYVYFNECGWSAYTYAGQVRYYFRFSDSATTNAYKHAGNFDPYPVQYDSSTNYFAGIVCIHN